MKVYRRVWRYGWGSISAALVGLACLRWGPGVALACVMAAACGWSLTAAASATMAPEVRRVNARRGLRVGIIAGTTAVAVLALAAANAPMAAVAVVVAAATSPRVIARLRRTSRWSSQRPAPAAAAPAPTASTAGTDALEDPELCRAWRTSFGALLDAADPAERGRLVRLREQLLDELERRHPEAIRAWLASVPRAADGPERYLRLTRPGGREAA